MWGILHFLSYILNKYDSSGVGSQNKGLYSVLVLHEIGSRLSSDTDLMTPKTDWRAGMFKCTDDVL